MSDPEAEIAKLEAMFGMDKKKKTNEDAPPADPNEAVFENMEAMFGINKKQNKMKVEQPE